MMKKNLLLQLLLWLVLPSYARLGDDDKPKDSKPIAVINSTGGAIGEATRTKAVSFQMQQDLDEALERFKVLQAGKAVTYIDRMDDIPVSVSELAEDDRSTAYKLMSFLDQNPDRVKEDVGFEDLTVLPVGIKKRLNDQSQVTMGILRAEFRQEYAELTVFVRLQTSVNGTSSSIKQRDLLFGVEKLRFTKQGGMSSASFKAVLLGDYLLPYEKWTVRLKGGVDKSEIPADSDPNRCYVEFDCGSFKRINVAADVIIPRNVLLPCTQDGEVIRNENVRVTVSNLRVFSEGGLRNIIFSSGVITPFALPNHEEYAFVVNNLIFDLSDTETPTSVVFPANYSGIDTDAKWRGLYVGSFSMLLPEEFEDKDNAGKRVSISATNMLWDRTGFSGAVNVSGINKKVNASKWTISLNYVGISFRQNNFVEGRFGGKIETPVHKQNEADNKLFDYAAVIFMDEGRSNYSLAVTTEKEIDMQLWWAKARIAPGSQVALNLLKNSEGKYRFSPVARLSGTMRIGAKKDGDAIGDYKNDETVNFGGIEFYNLTIQTVAPYVSVERFAYNAGQNNLLANFPVLITRFQKFEGQIGGQSATSADVWTEIGFKINLMKDNSSGESKFTGASNWVLRSRYDVNTGKLRPVGISVRRIEIKGTITPVSVNGFLDVMEDAAKKEIRGSLSVIVSKPKPFAGEVNVLFGRDKSADYKYGFIDGFIEGIAVDLFPGVQLYGAGIGVYWNMKPGFVSSPDQAQCPTISSSQILSYCPNRQVPFGIRMMASIRNTGGDLGTGGKTIYKARVYLDFALNREYGINHIAIYGNGVIAGDFGNGGDTPLNKKAAYTQMMGNKNYLETNIKEGQTDQATGTQQAKSLNRSINPDGAESPPTGTGVITFAAGFMLDIPSSTFHAELDVYLKQGNLSGIGPNGRVGKAVLHFAPGGNWYIHVGQAAKQNRVGIKYEQNGANLNIYAGIDAYLMIGQGVPQFPPPDKEVVDFFPALRNRFSGPVCTDLSNGKAFAFGASAKFSVKGNVSILHYEALAIAGLDILLAEQQNQSCGESWMGQGQLYALIKLRADIRTRWLKFSLLDAGAGLYVYIQAPKPFGFTGQVCVSVPKWVDKDRQSCLTLTVGSMCGLGNTTNCSSN